MAVTSIHSIKCTMNYAIDYIINPDKTDEQLLVTGVGCIPVTAAEEFAITRENARDGVNLGYHLIQSFVPGEIDDPQIAHKIGLELAAKVLGDQYEYVVSTHIDKGHIHNHIIFNSVDTKEYKHYNSDEKSYYDIRDISDKLCEENGLSVIADPQHTYAKKNSKRRYANDRQSRFGLTHSQKIKQAIDSCILKSNSYNEFLNNMKALGYKTNPNRKGLSFKNSDMDRYRRTDTLKGHYSEDNIRKLINDPQKEFKIAPLQIAKGKRSKRIYTADQQLFFDKRKADMQELRAIVDIINFLEDNQINDFNKADQIITDQMKPVINYSHSLQGQINVIDNKAEGLENIYQLCTEYKEAKQIYDKASFKGKAELKPKIEKMIQAIKSMGLEKIPNLKNLKADIAEVKRESLKKRKQYLECNNQIEKLQKFRKDLSTIMTAKNNDKSLNKNDYVK